MHEVIYFIDFIFLCNRRKSLQRGMYNENVTSIITMIKSIVLCFNYYNMSSTKAVITRIIVQVERACTLL